MLGGFFIFKRFTYALCKYVFQTGDKKFFSAKIGIRQTFKDSGGDIWKIFKRK